MTAPKQPPPFPSQPIPQPQLKLTSIQRPAVVTLIAVLQFIACGVMLLGFVGFIYVGVKEEKIVFDIVGSILFIFAILHFFAGLGLWHLQPYGRKLQLVLAYLGLLSI
ncbi:MAG TPA: hypothetical protein VLH08_09595, partial [Acidobacteriota bacterium]|nr:hypothetical protein [Acidobacteriota bacterium]